MHKLVYRVFRKYWIFWNVYNFNYYKQNSHQTLNARHCSIFNTCTTKEFKICTSFETSCNVKMSTTFETPCVMIRYNLDLIEQGLVEVGVSIPLNYPFYVVKCVTINMPIKFLNSSTALMVIFFLISDVFKPSNSKFLSSHMNSFILRIQNSFELKSRIWGLNSRNSSL